MSKPDAKLDNVKMMDVRKCSELIPLLINASVSDKIIENDEGKLHLCAAKYFNAAQSQDELKKMVVIRKELMMALINDQKNWFFAKKINKTIQDLLPAHSSLISLPLTPVIMIILGVACERQAHPESHQEADKIVKWFHDYQIKLDNAKSFSKTLDDVSIVELIDDITVKQKSMLKPGAKDIRFLAKPSLTEPLLTHKNCSLNS